MAKRTITESQYMELRGYEGGLPRWLAGGVKQSLVAQGLVSAAKHERGWFQITPQGTEALSAFRARYGVS